MHAPWPTWPSSATREICVVTLSRGHGFAAMPSPASPRWCARRLVVAVPTVTFGPERCAVRAYSAVTTVTAPSAGMSMGYLLARCGTGAPVKTVLQGSLHIITELAVVFLTKAGEVFGPNHTHSIRTDTPRAQTERASRAPVGSRKFLRGFPPGG